MWGRIQSFFEKLAFTRSEIHVIQIVVLVTLIGAWVPTVRSWLTTEEPDVTALMETAFKERVHMLDTVEHSDTTAIPEIAWRRRADKIEGLIALGQVDSVSALLEHYEDAPVVQVDINAAGIEELASLPRIGPKLAERVLDYRRQHGPFQSADELTRVKGIGRKMLETIRPYITIH